MTDSIAHRLAEWTSVTQTLPEEVLEDVRRRVLDSVGLMLAAAALSDEARAVRAVMEAEGSSGRASVVGGSRRLPASAAAFVNGTLAHALDFDDTHLPSVLHPSATIVPAVLAVAEEDGISDDGRVLAAIAAGIEITNRVGMGSYDDTIRNSVMFEHGFHATSICGAVGAAAATTMLVGGDATLIANAMAVAASMGSGIIEANRTGGTVKKIHCGWAAHAGINAMRLALAGITGPSTVFEGRFGFYEAFSRGFVDEEAVVGELGHRWELLRTHFKPYPANHFTHAAVDAALSLRAKGLPVDQIKGIRLGVAAPTLRTIAEPEDVKSRPATPYAAQFSGPFVLAQALRSGGGLGLYLDDFTEETISDPDTLAIAGRVSCYADDVASGQFPHGFPAVVSVQTEDGRLWEVRVDHNRGGPAHPLSDDELLMKFRLNASHAADPDQVERLGNLILSLGGGTLGAVFAALGCDA